MIRLLQFFRVCFSRISRILVLYRLKALAQGLYTGPVSRIKIRDFSQLGNRRIQPLVGHLQLFDQYLFMDKRFLELPLGLDKGGACRVVVIRLMFRAMIHRPRTM